MSKLKISLGYARNAWTAPILDGEVTVEGVELIPSVVPPNDLFHRQLRYGEFDASEFSISQLIAMHSRGNTAWLGIPAFPSRGYFHTRIYVNRDAGIDGLADLRGKRVGLPEYQQTAALWTRGVLEHDYGIKPTDIHWVMGRPLSRSHGVHAGFTPPAGLSFQHLDEGENIAEFLVQGKIDAIIAYSGGRSRSGLGLGQEPPRRVAARSEIDPTWYDLDEHPATRPLFADHAAAGYEYFQRHGVIHINHVLVLRSEIAEQYPWVARNLYDAFAEARALGIQRMERALEPSRALGAVDIGRYRKGTEAMRYGVLANAELLETATSWSFDQGLSVAKVDPRSLFAESVSAL
ncbi:PhnD/SsuA/transferrin family substrate-binding protein [Dactylosporangium sp. NPDC005555]|uniref:PhnD/SsuA/transferrin family substrate-binding protein n=1 Tax=Dactylosporangium sp. NPDC005555 TaxID=3154889 RepID=UPI0033B7CBF7